MAASDQMTPLLDIAALSKRFGGIVAVDDVALELWPGELHALIGPNGAGKTTLVQLLSGALPADSGTIAFDGERITHLPMHRRVRRGLARSYQASSVFPHFTVLENVALAVQANEDASLGLWRPVAAQVALFQAAHRRLEAIGLAARVDVLAADLSHGERRLLELGLAMATGARLLLLDEPMAGLGPDESQRIVALLAGLKGRLTILLVEHDMDAVFKLADRISTLVQGRIIATGVPEEIRRDPEVRRAYLGETAS